MSVPGPSASLARIEITRKTHFALRRRLTQNVTLASEDDDPLLSNVCTLHHLHCAYQRSEELNTGTNGVLSGEIVIWVMPRRTDVRVLEYL